jgi:hypothetical protein
MFASLLRLSYVELETNAVRYLFEPLASHTIPPVLDVTILHFFVGEISEAA